jgi:hypothetical protein
LSTNSFSQFPGGYRPNLITPSGLPVIGPAIAITVVAVNSDGVCDHDHVRSIGELLDAAIAAQPIDRW